VNVLDHTIFLDAGTGIVPAGQQLVRNFFANRDKMKRLNVTILVSHTHHDHVMGLPFFRSPFHWRRFPFHLWPSVYGPVGADTGMKFVLESLMDGMFFPIDLMETNSIKRIETLKPFDQILLEEGVADPILTNPQGDMKVSFKDKVIVTQYRAYNHPKNGTLVYKLQYAGKSVVYATRPGRLCRRGPQADPIFQRRRPIDS